MHPLLTQLSAIVALLVLLNQLWGAASIERTLVMSAMTGLVVYSVLFAGQLTLRYILMQSEAAASDEAEVPAEPDTKVGPDADPAPSTTP
jgi:hypothetical protein